MMFSFESRPLPVGKEMIKYLIISIIILAILIRSLVIGEYIISILILLLYIYIVYLIDKALVLELKCEQLRNYNDQLFSSKEKSSWSKR